MVEVRGLVHAYGSVEVLAGIDLDVAEGDFVAVLGPSGCGKSTLLKVLAGLVVPSAGSVLIDGVDVIGHPGRTAYQPQRDALLPWRRVVPNAALGAELAGVPRAEARAAAFDLLERFGLGGFERAWPAQLSGGMRQRVAVARTFLTGRAPLLLDEPFGALDALTRRELYAWLEEMWTTEGAGGDGDGDTGGSDAPALRLRNGAASGRSARRTSLLVTHDVDEALTLADRVVVVSARPGRVVAEVTVPFDRPRRPELLGDPVWTGLRHHLLASLGA